MSPSEPGAPPPAEEVAAALAALEVLLDRPEAFAARPVAPAWRWSARRWQPPGAGPDDRGRDPSAH